MQKAGGRKQEAGSRRQEAIYCLLFSVFSMMLTANCRPPPFSSLRYLIYLLKLLTSYLLHLTSFFIDL
jgi:hypothetical protein